MDENNNRVEDLDAITRWLKRAANNEDTPFLFFLGSFFLMMIFGVLWLFLLGLGQAGVYIYLAVSAGVSILGFSLGLAYFKEHRDSILSFTFTLLNLVVAIVVIILMVSDWRQVHF